jgi:hypothetical protein
MAMFAGLRMKTNHPCWCEQSGIQRLSLILPYMVSAAGRKLHFITFDRQKKFNRHSRRCEGAKIRHGADGFDQSAC